MPERIKRALFIVGFAVLVVGLGIGLFVIFFRVTPAPTTPTTPPTEIETEGGLPSSGAAGTPVAGETGSTGELPSAGAVPGGIPGTTRPPQTSLLVESVSQQVAPSADGAGARFYNPVDGKFYRALPDGRVIPLSSASFPNVESVAWGNETDQAILSFPDDTKIHYDFQTQKQTSLPKHWNDFDFSSDDTNVIVKSEPISPESRYLVISDPDGKNSRAIQALGENGDKVHASWTGNSQIVAYSETGAALGYDRQQIVLIGKNNENFRGLIVEGRGFEPLWSPSGQKILYSAWTVENGYKPELWISGGAPANLNADRVKLDIQTWANKCAWADEQTIYCGVPESIPRGAGLQPGLFTSLEDRIVRINLSTGRKTDLGKPSGNPSIRNPVVTKDQSVLIYADTATGKLYSFRLD